MGSLDPGLSFVGCFTAGSASFTAGFSMVTLTVVFAAHHDDVLVTGAFAEWFAVLLEFDIIHGGPVDEPKSTTRHCFLLP